MTSMKIKNIILFTIISILFLTPFGEKFFFGNANVQAAPLSCPSSPPSYPLDRWDRVWCDSDFNEKLADFPDQPELQFDDSWFEEKVGGIREDHIGFRSGRKIYLEAGTYTFYLGSDDGSRLWIDGELCIDNWGDHLYHKKICTKTFSTSGFHNFRIDYYDQWWFAIVRFWYKKDYQFIPCPSSPTSYPEDRWDIVWCDSDFIEKLADAPDESNLQFDRDWVFDEVGGIREDDVGFRAGRRVYLNAGTYVFYLGADDGANLWIDDNLCVDNWAGHAYQERSCILTFPNSGFHNFRIDFYEIYGVARVKFYFKEYQPPPPPSSCPSSPTSYPEDRWDRVWCDSNFYQKLADDPDQSNLEFEDYFWWGLVGGIREDDIGFRSGRRIYLEPGTYTFYLGSDDGSKLWIDGILRIYNWGDHSYQIKSYTKTFYTPGFHNFRIDYYERSGQSRVKFYYDKYQSFIPCPSSSLSYPEDRWDRVWCDENFNQKLADDPDEPNLQFDNKWGYEKVGGIRMEAGFRSGRKIYLEAGTYNFYLGSDDGSRLWIDGELCIDNWEGKVYYERKCTKTFPTSGYHNFRIDFYDGDLAARVKFRFELANLPPNASFSCDSSQCPGGNGPNCIMYQPTSDINPCIFTLRNDSTDPDGYISLTKWFIKKKTEPDSSFREIGSCAGKCDHTIQKTDVPDPGVYTVILYVEDNRGASAAVEKDLIVKREISAGFMCSTDNSNWKPCETIKIFPGRTIFVRDDPSLPEHSVPSEGALINSRTWQKGNGTDFETFAQNKNNASTTLTFDKKIIRLIVTDTASRSDRQDHQVSVTYPLPFFKEIPPIFFRIREFLASLILKIRAF
jgi:hypothetical protein